MFRTQDVSYLAVQSLRTKSRSFCTQGLVVPWVSRFRSQRYFSYTFLDFVCSFIYLLILHFSFFEPFESCSFNINFIYCSLLSGFLHIFYHSLNPLRVGRLVSLYIIIKISYMSTRLEKVQIECSWYRRKIIKR